MRQFFGVIGRAANIGHSAGTYTLDGFQTDFPQFFHKVTGEDGREETVPFLPVSVLEGLIARANAAIQPDKWLDGWRYACGLYTAHYATLYLGEPPMNFIRGTVKGGKIPFGANALDVAARLGSKAKQYEGKEIVFGFRPEAIELGKKVDVYAIQALVELTEMLGDNTNVYITAGEEKAILKVDPHDTPEIDSEITFSIPFGDVYLFDGETENVIETTK